MLRDILRFANFFSNRERSQICADSKTFLIFCNVLFWSSIWHLKLERSFERFTWQRQIIMALKELLVLETTCQIAALRSIFLFNSWQLLISRMNMLVLIFIQLIVTSLRLSTFCIISSQLLKWKLIAFLLLLSEQITNHLRVVCGILKIVSLAIFFSIYLTNFEEVYLAFFGAKKFTLALCRIYRPAMLSFDFTHFVFALDKYLVMELFMRQRSRTFSLK